MITSSAPEPRLVRGREGGGDARPAVRLVDVTKSYGDLAAVHGLTLEIASRELFTLLGPSGSGKTTVLRMVAGLIAPTHGQIWVGEREVGSQPTYERNIGMVFQSLALFPHMDVFANIAFPLRMRRIGRTESARRVKEALDIVRLPDIAKRNITELSGGQQQRVALARALVYHPELLLLDEPFGALDLKLREEMQLEIVRLHAEIDVTIINVTHDQREALMLSDRIGVMRSGVLEQVGAGRDVYQHPTTEFVARFIGNTNIIAGELRQRGEDWVLRTEGGAPVPVVEPAAELSSGVRASLVLRAENILISASPERIRLSNVFPGRILLKAFQGSATQFEVEVPSLGARLRVEATESPQSGPLEIGGDVFVGWDPSDAVLVLAGS